MCFCVIPVWGFGLSYIYVRNPKMVLNVTNTLLIHSLVRYATTHPIISFISEIYRNIFWSNSKFLSIIQRNPLSECKCGIFTIRTRHLTLKQFRKTLEMRLLFGHVMCQILMKITHQFHWISCSLSHLAPCYLPISDYLWFSISKILYVFILKYINSRNASYILVKMLQNSQVNTHKNRYYFNNRHTQNQIQFLLPIKIQLKTKCHRNLDLQ